MRVEPTVKVEHRVQEGLDDEQERAAAHGLGPSAVTAAAGAGKTRVVVARVARLVAAGVPPARILAFTFTRHAAREMNVRLSQWGVTDCRIGTIHSVAYEIIRSDGVKWGGEFAVDEGGKLHVLLKKLVQQELRIEDIDVELVESFISLCKARGLCAHPNVGKRDTDRIVAFAEEIAPTQRMAKLWAEIYFLYEARRVAERLIGFDDMLLLAVELLESDELARAKWTARYEHVLMDEAHDSSLVQWRLSEILAERTGNLMIVFDENQSLYSWRGAVPRLVIEFVQREGVTLYPLSTNYRSLEGIVERSSRIVLGQPWNLKSEFRAARKGNGVDPVEVVAFDSPEEQAEHFVEQMKCEYNERGRWSDFAVLSRVTKEFGNIEAALLRAAVPYRVLGAGSFWDRREVKSLLGYLEVASLRDPDGTMLLRILNAPFRYLGRAFVAALQAEAASRKCHLVDALLTVQMRQRRQMQSAGEVYYILQDINRRIAKNERPAEILRHLINRTRYVAWLRRDEGSDPSGTEGSRADIIEEVIRAADSFATAGAFLDHVEKLREEMRKARRRGDGGDLVTLATIHAYKGLEAHTVFAATMNEGVMPHWRSTDADEERRIAYVLVTRARDRLVCGWLRTLVTFGRVCAGKPSPYLRDMGFEIEDEELQNES